MKDYIMIKYFIPHTKIHYHHRSGEKDGITVISTNFSTLVKEAAKFVICSKVYFLNFN